MVYDNRKFSQVRPIYTISIVWVYGARSLDAILNNN